MKERIREQLQDVILILCVSLIITSVMVYGQRNKGADGSRPISTCTLGVSKAPHVRGLYLGMPIDEFLRLFPSAIRGNYDPELEREEYSDYSTISIPRIEFLDRKLALLLFKYDDFNPISADNFMRQTTSTLGLPTTGWRREGTADRVLTCKGFTVRVSTGNYGRRIENPALMLIDDVASAKESARRKDMHTRAMEIQRRRQRERSIFKP